MKTTAVATGASWDDLFISLSKGSGADFGSDFQHPMLEDLVPDPQDVLPTNSPGDATRHPDYDIFGRDSGHRGPARADRPPGYPRGYGRERRERERERRELREEERQALQAAEQAELQGYDPLSEEETDFAGDSEGKGLPGWAVGLLGILGIWGVAEFLGHKGQRFAQRRLAP